MGNILHIDTGKTTIIHNAPGRLLVLALLGLAMTALSLAIALGAFGAGLRGMIFGWIGTMFFGAAALITLRRLLAGPVPVITFSPTGLHDRRLAKQEIPWPAIRSLGLWAMSGQKFMIVDVPPEVEQDIGLNPIAARTRKANALLGADGLAIGAQGTTIGIDNLLHITEAYLKAHGA